ncbi:hypothetical protein BBBOND_0304780 [Babesia bigemina]|uniref:Uncharacterized protein n=1 Tax=Babesia bigemina TaxID=5866 RepID=A0A061DDU2_BABBI|nr:hypothetical protein BBBOND_0304780 [Babesia bigemina]CDR96575.1 hypothetical protein BBBOND_0304780 [Babesia bigemina]|eukprot:XP_012768761.1 hypothetical protein BBBOND_0304780 [Babesia bigemina]
MEIAHTVNNFMYCAKEETTQLSSAVVLYVISVTSTYVNVDVVGGGVHGVPPLPPLPPLSFHP